MFRSSNIRLHRSALWLASAANGYSSPFWMTYKQSQEIGGQVRKGEKSTLVVYAGAIEKTEEGANGEEIEQRIPFLKGYCVFNCDQIVSGVPLAH